nr:ATP-binding protein [Pseudobdellovibrionaceae bacterium]
VREGVRNVYVSIDVKLVRDLLFNICKNAAEANLNSTQITLEMFEEADFVALTIHNTGVQIPDTLRNTLFDPYISTKLGYESQNMGLGLTIARKIALDHGGDLRLLEASDGAKFQVELPRIDSQNYMHRKGRSR